MSEYMHADLTPGPHKSVLKSPPRPLLDCPPFGSLQVGPLSILHCSPSLIRNGESDVLCTSNSQVAHHGQFHCFFCVPRRHKEEETHKTNDNAEANDHR